MADTKPCPACKNPIASNAEKCPSCGHVPLGVVWMRALPALGVVILVIALLMKC